MILSGVQNISYAEADFYEGLKGPKSRPARGAGFDSSLYVDDGKVLSITVTEFFRDAATYLEFLSEGHRECIELNESGGDSVVAIHPVGGDVQSVNHVRIKKKISVGERTDIFNQARDEGPVLLVYKRNPVGVLENLAPVSIESAPA